LNAISKSHLLVSPKPGLYVSSLYLIAIAYDIGFIGQIKGA